MNDLALKFVECLEYCVYLKDKQNHHPQTVEVCDHLAKEIIEKN